ncbi:MAG: Eco57I restriction-modification methylase domain-containing protein [Candidatus Flexifilum sp.]
MDKALRNLLYTAIVNCRRLLETDFRQQLEGIYGIRPDGETTPIEALPNLDAVGRADRAAIEAFVQHEIRAGAEMRTALERYVRESAFTCLNRLAALKLFEHPARGILMQTVGAGDQSKAFTQLKMVSPEAFRTEPDGGYRLFLELLFDDLAQLVGVLFDQSLPTAILFPSQSCLIAVLNVLNDPALADAWAEDETIGWVYQYFTPGELRQTVRAESAAPRNAYELSFRNQFYTPRYVVAFLAENTLGRLWYTMRGGETALAGSCRYLITRIPPDERPPKRDPRTLRILDPACGSGHFLLYCFDLLETIYAEAYDDPDLGDALRADYPDPDDFRRAVPRLIVQHNLHGIDIDLRAAQIATLALWLRAQRSYKALKLKMKDRPRIDDIHIVVAEPMPGESDLLGAFARDLKPAALGTMLFELWAEMKLAGEVGSLLQIETAIRTTIDETRRALEALPESVQLTLFGPDRPQQLALPFKRADLDDTAFWANAEARVVAALREFSGAASADDDRVRRRLFVDDAIQGMAFIDLLLHPYDVVLMNPPFGASSIGGKAYIEAHYPRTKHDLYAAFVERGLGLLRPGGYLGAITSRTGFFLSSFQKWREEILLREANFIAMADLGYGVLDTAMVETAAYVMQKKHDQRKGEAHG